MKNLLTTLFILTTLLSFGQDKTTGVIQGTVIDSETAEGLPSAQVELIETSEKQLSDFDGLYKFSKLAPGVYSIKIAYPGFPVKTITEIQVKQGEVITIDVTMAPEKLDSVPEVVITAKRITDTDAGVVLKQKNAASVGDGMSSQTIARSTASSTSDVVKMVSGASIVDNKFAVIRGLNDRYNAAFLNGAPLPSSESDRKAFSFDMFPANMLDNLTITKSATPDQPAEFAGGLIQIFTKSIPSKNFYSFSIGGGYNTITTFKPRMKYQGGKLDWLGVDDGSRAMPSSIPNYGDYPLNMHDQAKVAQTFTTNWNTMEAKFAPNYQAQFSAGFATKLFNRDLGIITALTYNRRFNYNETVRRGYTNGTNPNNAQASQLDYEYLDQNNESSVLGGALANFSLKLNENNTVSFKNIYSLNSSDKLIYRTGTINPLESNPNLLRSTARWFTSNNVYSGQLEGQHLLKNKVLRINWLLGYSNVKRTIPNLSRSIYTRNKYIIDPSNPNARDTMYVANISYTNVGASYGGGMFFSTNKENSINERIDFTWERNLGKLRNEFKFGVYSQIRNRDFSARQLGYTRYGAAGGAVKFDENLLYLSEDKIFAPENMGITQAAANGNPAVGGFKLTDGTKFSDAYTAKSFLHAAYVMGDMRVSKFRFIYGARMEYFNQQLNAFRDDNSELKINTAKLDILPSLNMVFEATPRSNVRFSYSQTLNRPEYRELAPFAFYDFTTNFVVSGNDTLQRALIHNIDLRYETFPGRGQIFSATVFYKNFQNPIEQKSRADVVNEITFQNVPTATNYGLEFEARTLVTTLFGGDTSSFFDNLTLYSNLSIIRSKVDVSNVAGSSYSSRPLQGQSPYVFNAGIRFDSKKNHWGISVNLNRVGQRIAIVGNVNEPDLWEQARTFLDVQLTKSFWKNRAQFKLNISNILAQDQVFYQNNNIDDSRAKGANGFFNTIFVGDKNNKQGYNADVDQQIWKTNFGRTFTASLTFNL
jgi:hypothetical protein